MKPPSKSVPRALTRRALFAAPVAALIPSVGARNSEYSFHHDHMLGTSLDLVLNATSLGERDANAAHAAVFDEIERLSKVLSTYDPASEISRWRAGACSQDLSAVLDAYATWQRRSAGAISAQFVGRSMSTPSAKPTSPSGPWMRRSKPRPRSPDCCSTLVAISWFAGRFHDRSASPIRPRARIMRCPSSKCVWPIAPSPPAELTSAGCT